MLAQIHADADGHILRLIRDEQDAALMGTDPPPGTAATVTFDPATNPALVPALLAEWGRYDVAAGVLRRDGQPVPIAPPPPDPWDGLLTEYDAASNISLLKPALRKVLGHIRQELKRQA